jgi:glycosyltransferase involved in cell wall biosynthesis
MEEPRGRPADKAGHRNDGASNASVKLSVVVPVLNERKTIEEILWRVQAVDLEKEIIVVDDGSTDGTREFLQTLAASGASRPHAFIVSQRELHADNIRVLFQDRNRGKGAALRRGFAEARGDIVLVQDADLEYDPEEYHNLIGPIERGVADVVFGSRFLGGHTGRCCTGTRWATGFLPLFRTCLRT